MRPFEMTKLLQECGFEIKSFDRISCPEPDYFRDLLVRLRQSPHSAYQHTLEEDLRPVGGFYQVRKLRADGA
jgi:hypothetical protein